MSDILIANVALCDEVDFVELRKNHERAVVYAQNRTSDGYIRFIDMLMHAGYQVMRPSGPADVTYYWECGISVDVLTHTHGDHDTYAFIGITTGMIPLLQALQRMNKKIILYDVDTPRLTQFATETRTSHQRVP